MSVVFADGVLHVQIQGLSPGNTEFPSEQALGDGIAGGPPIEAIATELASVVLEPVYYSNAAISLMSAEA